MASQSAVVKTIAEPGQPKWRQYFDATEVRGMSRCKLCLPTSKPISASGGTSNLRAHIKSYHYEIYKATCIAAEVGYDPPPKRARFSTLAASASKSVAHVDDENADNDLPAASAATTPLRQGRIDDFVHREAKTNDNQSENPNPLTGNQREFVKNIIRFFATAKFADLAMLEDESFWTITKCKKHDVYDTPEKVFKMIRQVVEGEQIVAKGFLKEANSVALSIHLVKSEEKTNMILTTTARVLVEETKTLDGPTVITEKLFPLALTESLLLFTPEDVKAYLESCLKAWDLDASKVVGVVVDVDQENLFDIAEKMFPQASITPCLFQACQKFLKVFDSYLLGIPVIKDKIISVYQAIMGHQKVLELLSDDEQMCLRQAQHIHQKIELICSKREKLGSALHGGGVYKVTAPSDEDAEALVKHKELAFQLHKTILSVTGLGQISTSMFPAMMHFLKVKINELFKLELGDVSTKMRREAQRFLHYGNRKNVHVMALLDPRVKDRVEFEPSEAYEAHLVLDKEISRVKVAVADHNTAKIDDDHDDEVMAFYNRMLDVPSRGTHNVQLPPDPNSPRLGMSNDLRKYLDEVLPGMCHRTAGNLHSLWSERKNHPLNKLSIKLGPALSVAFGPTSAICNCSTLDSRSRQLLRDYVVFMRYKKA